MTSLRSDVLIIGSGIAGLSYALDAAERGRVNVITKKERTESNTNYAQGGIASVTGADDSYQLHIEDTLAAGAGLCHEDAVDVLVREGPAGVRRLIEMGVNFTSRGPGLDLGREGGHSRNRIVHARDRSGFEIERALLQAVGSHPNIQIFENHISLELITEHHFARSASHNTPLHCWGAYALDIPQNVVRTFLAPTTVLCSGGAGQVYLHTTNPPIATGDGVAMAYRAGAAVGNMEFIQFHPTSLFNSGSPAFLISEAVRGFGGILTTKRGDEFMQRYDARGALAPRDIVARAIDSELKRNGDDYVYLDLRHLPADEVRNNFPLIFETCLRKYKLDITAEPVPVVPAAHYCCGGVVTDLWGRTSIGGLYACGEVAMTGVHGANRLASNSLLEAIVFSHRAFTEVSGRTERTPAIPDIPDWDDSGTWNSEEWVLVEHDRREIQQIMWDYVGIVRSNLRLERAARRIRFILDEVEAFYKHTKVAEGVIELRNLATVAELIIRSATIRKESRGLHFTTDYPAPNDREWRKDTILQYTDS